jgi:DNA repair exonuclease SbcCD ATPase subunit
LEEVLNSYSKTLLPEDYKFSLEMDTQFRIEVTRNGALPSDVRRLSGAESSLFSLLLWAGLMSFVPKAARPNVLILDELDANMSEETKERFCEFLPKLLNVVEHIVVVTPQSDVRYEDYVPNVKYVTVVKKGLTAKIVQGKASDQFRRSKNVG